MWNKIAAMMLFVTYSGMSISATNRLSFQQACVKGDKLVIAATGDVLLHAPLQIKGAKKGYMSLWKEAIPYLQAADISYTNLEGPIANGVNKSGLIIDDPGDHFDDEVYTSFPMFNYPPALASALKASGFDIVSTANNHTLDRYAIGVERTIDELNNSGLNYVGTNKRGSDKPRISLIRKKGISIAWIACTENTNGVRDEYNQVLHCYQRKDKKWILDTIRDLKQKVDAIIVAPHWGVQYEHQPQNAQITFAHQVLNAGATAIIGSHPHVLQPMEKYITKDGRETFIIYSMGNFVSFQGTPKNRSTIILLLGLTKTAHGTVINGVQFIPMFMENRSGLENIHISKISKFTPYLQSYQIIGSVLPMENAHFSDNVITNPACY